MDNRYIITDTQLDTIFKMVDMNTSAGKEIQAVAMTVMENQFVGKSKGHVKKYITCIRETVALLQGDVLEERNGAWEKEWPKG